jgi:hypothetical protein
VCRSNVNDGIGKGGKGPGSTIGCQFSYTSVVWFKASYALTVVVTCA